MSRIILLATCILLHGADTTAFTKPAIYRPIVKYNPNNRFSKISSQNMVSSKLLSLDQSVVPKYVFSKVTKIIVTATVFLCGVILSSFDEEVENDEYSESDSSRSRKGTSSSRYIDDEYDTDYRTDETKRSNYKSIPMKTVSPKLGGRKAAAKDAKGNVFSEFVNATQLLFNIIMAKISLGTETFKDTFAALFGSEEEAMDLKEWNVCELEKREKLNHHFSRYRFKLPYEDATLPLKVGQELFLCSVDSEAENVVKEPFFPITLPSIKGYFDVLISSSEASTSFKFYKALRALEKGDEIAFKGGANRLRYEGEDGTINFISFFASGIGITPALSILRGVLPEGDSTVDDTELLWINEEVDDYVCDKEVENLEYKFIEKCSVTRIVQRDLYHNEVVNNRQVLEAISEYDVGRIAIICVPAYLLKGAYELYIEKGYPHDNIIPIGL